MFRLAPNGLQARRLLLRKQIADLHSQVSTAVTVLAQALASAAISEFRHALVIPWNAHQEAGVGSRLRRTRIRKDIKRMVEDAAFLHENRIRLMQTRSPEFQPASCRLSVL